MNRTSIEWCTHSWNPMTGCLHGCPYCYACKIAERFKGSKAWPEGFKPIFHPKRLGEPTALIRAAIIFAGSMTDIFGDWWTEEQILQVLLVIMGDRHHRFVILTKNPDRMFEILKKIPAPELPNCYFGTSVTGAQPLSDLFFEMKRLQALHGVHELGFKTVISFEPLLHDPGALIASLTSYGRISWADWIIIGGQTNPTKIPDVKWVNAIQEPAYHNHQPIFVKNNVGFIPILQQFPADLLPIAQARGKGTDADHRWENAAKATVPSEVERS